MVLTNRNRQDSGTGSSLKSKLVEGSSLEVQATGLAILPNSCQKENSCFLAVLDKKTSRARLAMTEKQEFTIRK